MKGKENFAKHFAVCKFFRITMHSWWFIWLFRIVKVYQCFFTLDLFLDAVDRGLGYEKKKLLDTIYIYRFFLNIVTDDLS